MQPASRTSMEPLQIMSYILLKAVSLQLSSWYIDRRCDILLVGSRMPMHGRSKCIEFSRSRMCESEEYPTSRAFEMARVLSKHTSCTHSYIAAHFHSGMHPPASQQPTHPDTIDQPTRRTPIHLTPSPWPTSTTKPNSSSPVFRVSR